MAKKWHPDRFTGPAKVEAELRFRMLAEAYNLLKDTPRREDDGPARSAAEAGPAAAPKPGSTPPAGQPQIALEEERPAAGKSVEDWFREAKAAAEAKSYDTALGLIQYAIRLNGERAEFHAFQAKLLDETNGDKRLLIRALESALKLNPRDVDSTILLAQAFQALGMHARASRLWSVAHNLAPNHAIFLPVAGKPASGKGQAKSGAVGLGDQFAMLLANAKNTVNRIFKRG